MMTTKTVTMKQKWKKKPNFNNPKKNPKKEKINNKFSLETMLMMQRKTLINMIYITKIILMMNMKKKNYMKEKISNKEKL